MEAQILNSAFDSQCIIDGFESFIWTDRYYEPGDFEMYLPVERAPLEYIKEGWYVWIKESDRLGIIEDITIETDAEEGPHVTFTGRTLESILDRRRVLVPTKLTGNMQEELLWLLNDGVGELAGDGRTIDGIRFVENDDPRFDEIEISADYFGEDLLTIVQDLAVLHEFGFKMIYNEEENTFDFSLYFGDDRSYNQEDLPWVVFSDRYDNLLGSRYYESKKNLRTAAVVVGSENYSMGQQIVYVNAKPEMTGLNRREMYVDASDIEPPEVEEFDEESFVETLPDYYDQDDISKAIAREKARIESLNEENRQIYMSALKERGYAELAQTYVTQAFEGEIAGPIQYIYGRDYFIGDIVQVHDQYGKQAATRITEVIRSHDVNGEALTPTFTTLIGGDNKGDITEDEDEEEG